MTQEGTHKKYQTSSLLVSHCSTILSFTDVITYRNVTNKSLSSLLTSYEIIITEIYRLHSSLTTYQGYGIAEGLVTLSL